MLELPYMDIISTIIIFVFGLAFGSFVNALVYRIHHKKSIIRGRSKCPQCEKALKPLELIPVISFIMQKGKCKHCRKKISWQYPLTELGTALVFVLIYGVLSPMNIDRWLLTIGYMFFAIFLISIFIYDFKYYLIPDILVVPAIILAVIFSLINSKADILQVLLGSIIAGGFFLILVLVSREKWMGWGDVKLVFFIGALMGWPEVLVGLMLSFVSGAIVGILLIMFKKKGMKSEVPFGTFLCLGTLITMLWGNIIIDWYLNLVGF